MGSRLKADKKAAEKTHVTKSSLTAEQKISKTTEYALIIPYLVYGCKVIQ